MMTWKLKLIAAAVAFAAVGTAQAEFTNPRGSTIADTTTTGTTGGSLIFEAWDANQAFIFDLGKVFNPIYDPVAGAPTAVLTQAPGNTVYKLGNDFVSTFGSNSNVQWRVLSGKSANDSTSRQGILVSSKLNSGYGLYNNGAVNTALTNLNTGFNNIISNVSEPGGLVNNTSPAYTPNNTSVNIGSVLPTALGAINGSGYFSGSIDPTMSYAFGNGVMFFTAVISSSSSAGSQTTKTAFAGDHDNNPLTAPLPANWILKNDGTLTYHVATAVPEPETYAMMLLGVGLIGWRLRASARKSRALRLA